MFGGPPLFQALDGLLGKALRFLGRIVGAEFHQQEAAAPRE